MDVTIRQGITADAPALAALAAIAFPFATTPATAPEEIERHIAEQLTDAHFATYLADPTRHVLIADAAGTLVGYAMLVLGEPDDPDVLAAVAARPTVDLNKFYVHPDAHGTGVAAPLMHAAISVARAQGARSVWLGVSDENGRANRFYAKHGFVIVGTKQFRIGDRFEDDHIRELLLSPGAAVTIDSTR